MKITIPNGGEWGEAVASVLSFLQKQESTEWMDSRFHGNNKIGGGLILALSGSLGAGKTTFVQALARVLGCKDVIKSPTFTLRNEYALPTSSANPPAYQPTRLIHIDAYRIEDPREAMALGLEEDLATPGTMIAIEWPEHLPESYFKHAPVVRVQISINKDGSRAVTME